VTKKTNLTAVKEPGPIPGSGGDFERSGSCTVDVCVDELRRSVLYGSGCRTGGDYNLQPWKHGGRSLGDGDHYGESFGINQQDIDHEHRSGKFAELRSEPGQQLCDGNYADLRQPEITERWNLAGRPPLAKSGRPVTITATNRAEDDQLLRQDGDGQIQRQLFLLDGGPT